MTTAVATKSVKIEYQDAVHGRMAIDMQSAQIFRIVTRNGKTAYAFHRKVRVADIEVLLDTKYLTNAQAATLKGMIPQDRLGKVKPAPVPPLRSKKVVIRKGNAPKIARKSKS